MLSAAGRFEEVKATIEAPVEAAIQGLPVPGVQDEVQQVAHDIAMILATSAAVHVFFFGSSQCCPSGHEMLIWPHTCCCGLRLQSLACKLLDWVIWCRSAVVVQKRCCDAISLHEYDLAGSA